MNLRLHALAVLAAAAPLAAQDLPVSGPTLGLGPGPWDKDLALILSEDGRTFTPGGFLAQRADSVSLCLDGAGRLAAAFKWYPEERPESFDRLAVSFSEDDGLTWSDPVSIVISDLPEDLHRPIDPCLVALADGRFRLYFTSYPGSVEAEPAYFLPGQWPTTYSAISDDAILWTFEEGKRFGVEGSRVQHPTLAQFDGQWHYFAPVDGRDGVAYHAVSSDGLSFRRLPEITVENAGPWRGCALADGEMLRFFGFGRVGWGASSADGLRWRFEPRVRWGGPSDPSVVRLASGRLLLAGSLPGLREEDEEGAEAEATAALLEALDGGAVTGGRATLAANDRFVYVLRGEILYMFDAQTLRYLRHTRIPVPKAPGDDTQR